MYSYPIWITEWLLLCFPRLLCCMPAYCSETEQQRTKDSHVHQTNDPSPLVTYRSCLFLFFSFFLGLSLSFRRCICSDFTLSQDHPTQPRKVDMPHVCTPADCCQGLQHVGWRRYLSAWTLLCCRILLVLLLTSLAATFLLIHCPGSAKKLLSLDVIQCNLNYRCVDYKIRSHSLVISSESLNKVNHKNFLH